MDATHGFTPGNRRIYFDTTSKTFLPIYYDGQPNILDKKNNIIKNLLMEVKSRSILRVPIYIFLVFSTVKFKKYQIMQYQKHIA